MKVKVYMFLAIYFFKCVSIPYQIILYQVWRLLSRLLTLPKFTSLSEPEPHRFSRLWFQLWAKYSGVSGSGQTAPAPHILWSFLLTVDSDSPSCASSWWWGRRPCRWSWAPHQPRSSARSHWSGMSSRSSNCWPPAMMDIMQMKLLKTFGHPITRPNSQFNKYSFRQVQCPENAYWDLLKIAA